MGQKIERVIRQGKFVFEFLQPDNLHLDVNVADVFGEPAYVQQSCPEGVEHRAATIERGGNIHAFILFQIIDDRLVSLRYAPFSGVYFMRVVSHSLLLTWMAWIETVAKDLGFSSLHVKCPPSNLDEIRFSKNLSLFSQREFKSILDFNFVKKVTPESSFKVALDSSSRNKLNRCTRLGYNVQFDDSLSMIENVHSVIKLNREFRELPLSVERDQLSSIVARNEGKWFAGGVFDRDTLIAGGLFLRHQYRSIYIFMWGELPAYRRYSPLVLLANELYAKMAKDEVELLDLGTATNHSEIDRGLWDFKANIGFAEGAKFTFIKFL